MTFLIPVALFGWIPAVLYFFSAYPPRRAVVVALITGWLFLPFSGFDIPSLPDYTKLSATGLCVMLATALYCGDRLFALRFRWYDLPMTVWCLCPTASSLSNGLGLYDGLSTSFDHFVSWGLPYMVGRIYFTRLEHLRDLAVGIVIGGLVYVPFCLWEMRMSPQLHAQLYGISPGGWGEVVLGGYRPKVFMSCALELGLWMTAATTTGFWLWAGGSLKQLWNQPFGWLLTGLAVVAILCKVTGAWVLLSLGISLWYLSKWTDSRLPAILLILAPILYVGTRTTGMWTGEGAVNLVKTVYNERRAESLEFRMHNEDMLMAKALERPVFGWGGWNRASVENEEGSKVSIFDGMWIIALGNNGVVGLASYNLALLLPLMVLIKRYPVRAWQTPSMAPVAVLAVLTSLYSIDCIANAMLNPVYLVVLGGLTGALGAPGWRHSRGDGQQQVAHGPQRGRAGDIDLYSFDHGYLDEHFADPRESEAVRLASLGRALMEQGLTREAEEAWLSSVQHWADLAAEHPDELFFRKCWLDGVNDTAWSLVTRARPEAHSLARAIQLSEQAVGVAPQDATYWNTLGIAYYRNGDPRAAIHALERSVELGAGGTSFDFYFLAMAYARMGNPERARQWYSRAEDWMREHNPDHEDLLRFRAEAASLLDPQTIPV